MAPAIPIDGAPADVHPSQYANWLGTRNVPKLFPTTELGAILTKETLLDPVGKWPALTEKTTAAIHFVPEDWPDEIARAIASRMG